MSCKPTSRRIRTKRARCFPFLWLLVFSRALCLLCAKPSGFLSDIDRQGTPLVHDFTVFISPLFYEAFIPNSDLKKNLPGFVSLVRAVSHFERAFFDKLKQLGSNSYCAQNRFQEKQKGAVHVPLSYNMINKLHLTFFICMTFEGKDLRADPGSKALLKNTLNSVLLLKTCICLHWIILGVNARTRN